MDLFEFEVCVGVDYFVWGVVEAFVFDGNIYYAHFDPFMTRESLQVLGSNST